MFSWAEATEARYPELKLLFATLNGVRLTVGVAVKAKMAGNKRGVPDIILPVPRVPFHGLFIELKDEHKPAAVTPEQKAWHGALADQGYLCVVAKGWRGATEVIDAYLTNFPKWNNTLLPARSEPKRPRTKMENMIREVFGKDFSDFKPPHPGHAGDCGPECVDP